MSDEHDDEPRGEPLAHNRRLFLGLSAAGLASAVLSGVLAFERQGSRVVLWYAERRN